MAKVVALTKGYIDGILREPGEAFEISDDLWADKGRCPKWVRGPREVTEAVPAAVASETATADPAPKGKAKPSAKTVEAPTAAPFADAPENVALTGNGIQAALGGVAPDWLPPGSGGPQPVTD